METLRILFASDFHGSQRVYKKFLNAGKIYKADILVAGGDLTGKAIVPIIKRSYNYYTVRYKGEDLEIRSEEEVSRIRNDIIDSGYYPFDTTPEELQKLSAEAVDKLFSAFMKERIENWVKLAEERLKGIAKVYILPGNDDRFDIDEAFENSDFVENPEGKVIKINSYEMVATGFSNITPWNAPRDVPEDELLKKVDQMMKKVENMENCIFVSHCPPFACGIDFAPKLDANRKPLISGSGHVTAPAGSTAIRKAIETYQPLLGLHGHIHESPGVTKIGRTVCINPGSEYETGILKAALITLRKEKSKVDVENVFIQG